MGREKRRHGGRAEWTVWDVIRWKPWREQRGGGRTGIQRYGDAWVRFDKVTIVAVRYRLPPEPIAGVRRIEVGGDPTFIDSVAFDVRSVDRSGPEPTDRLTMTGRPETTPFGPVGMQLRTAAGRLGLDTGSYGHADRAHLAGRSRHDRYDIAIVGRCLRRLLAHDGLGASLPAMSRDAVRIVGARCNRGMSAPLADIRRHASYGDLIVRFRPRLHGLPR